MTNLIDIKIANLAVNLGCNIFVDEERGICLLRKFYNDEGVNIKKFDEDDDICFYSQEFWLKSIEQGDACRYFST